MRRSADQQHVDDLARRRLDALVAELGGRPRPVDDSPDVDAGPPRGSIWEDEPPRGRHAHRPLSVAGRVNGWLHDRLPETLRGRVAIGPAQVGVVTLLLACGVLWAAWATSRTADDAAAASSPVVVTPAASPVGSEAPLALPAGSGPSPLSSPGTAAGEPGAGVSELVVDVQGSVRRPGIVVLPVGSRVVDALEAAGGYTGRRGRLASLNLARPLVDGEQILVGRSAPAVPVPPAVSGASSAAGAPAALVSLNTADQATLETLPGVGPVTAAAILQWRDEHGPFTAVEQLLEVSGIGEKTLAEIAPHVTL